MLRSSFENRYHFEQFSSNKGHTASFIHDFMTKFNFSPLSILVHAWLNFKINNNSVM